MKNIFDTPTLRALRALDESPAIKAIRAIEDLSVGRMMRDISSSSAFHFLQDLKNSPAMRTIREIEESPITRMMRDLDNLPTLKAVRRIEESSAFMTICRLQESPAIKAIQALELSPVLDAFSIVVSQITHSYGALIFSEAYELLIEEYEEQVEEDASEPLAKLAESVKSKAAQAPFGPLSAEFYLSLVVALVLFYLSQISAEQSEERLLKRLDDMQQTVSVQLDALRDDSQGGIFLVADRAVNLRAGPGPGYDVLEVLLRNQKVAQLETSGEWMKVEYFDYVANALNRGWVNRRYFIVLAKHND